MSPTRPIPPGFTGHEAAPDVRENNPNTRDRLGDSQSAEQSQDHSPRHESTRRRRSSADQNREFMLRHFLFNPSSPEHTPSLPTRPGPANQSHAAPVTDGSPHRSDSTENLNRVLERSLITAQDEENLRREIALAEEDEIAQAAAASSREAQHEAAKIMLEDQLLAYALHISKSSPNPVTPTELPVSPPRANRTPGSAPWSGDARNAQSLQHPSTRGVIFELAANHPRTPPELEGSSAQFELPASVPSPYELEDSSPPPYTEH